MDADPTTGMLVGETQNFSLPSTFGPAGVHYGEYRIGGTSLASPLMAGAQAVAQANEGGRRIGFANPLIYFLARNPGEFYDVTPQGDPGNVRADYANGQQRRRRHRLLGPDVRPGLVAHDEPGLGRRHRRGQPHLELLQLAIGLAPLIEDGQGRSVELRPCRPVPVQYVVGRAKEAFMADRHSEYLARAVASLTPEGRARVDEVLAQLVTAGGGHESLVRFAERRKAEADAGRTDLTTDADPVLTEREFDGLFTGFTTIRDQEPLDDVADWANAVLALLEDDAAHDSPK